MDKSVSKLTWLLLVAPVFLVGLALLCPPSPAGTESPSPGPSRDKLLKLFSDNNPYLRAYAVYNLTYRFPDECAKLVPAISDAEPGVRRAAVFCLGLVRFEAATQRFLEALKDPHYGVRRAAVFALGNLKSPKAMQRVSTALKDSDPVVRKLAVLAMARAGAKSSVPRLISLLRDESPRVRRAAACALGMLGDRTALPALKRLLRDPSRSEPPKHIFLANNKVRQALRKKLNLDYKFLHFAETLDKLSHIAGVDIRVDDEVLFALNTSASDPQNLNSIKLAMWNVPFDKALATIVQTAGGYYYVESGRINISSKRYRAYDTPVALEVTGAMALLGDRSAIAQLRTFLRDPRYRRRARELLYAVTGR